MEPKARREQVLMVAARIFAEKGYRAASVADIVEGAGIGRGTFYLYFQSKKDIFLELIEGYFSEFASLLEENKARLQRAVSGEGQALETWRENIVRILEYHRDNIDVTSIVYRDATGNDEHFSTRVRELSAAGRRQILGELRLLKEYGAVRDCDLEIATTIIMGSAISIIMDQIVGGGGASLEELADDFMEYHVHALRNSGTI